MIRKLDDLPAGVLGFEAEGHRRPKFVRAYAEFERDAAAAIEQFCADVRGGTFPSSAETYHMTDRMTEALGLYGDTSAVEPELTQ